MPGPQFVSPGAEAGNAIQKFLVMRDMQDRQARLDALAQQQQDAEIRNRAELLKIQQAQEARQVQDSASTRAYQMGQLERQNQQDRFERAEKIYTQSVGGQVLTPQTVQELDDQGLSSTHYNVPGVLMQGPLQGEDQSDTAREAEIGKSPDTEQSIGGPAWQLARAAAADKEEAAGQARDDKATEAQKQRDFLATQNAATRAAAMDRVNAVTDRKNNEMVKIGPFQDPDTGRVVSRYVRRGQLATVGDLLKAPSGVLENRLEASEAVVNTGDKMIQELYNPELQKELGPVLGRYNTLEDFYGDPPEKFADLAGRIHSYALAMMGVHGMRSAEAAEKVQEMLSAHHTPESLIAMMGGLREFPVELMAQAHRKPKMDVPTGPASKTTTPGAAGTTTTTTPGSRVKILSVTPVGR